MSSQEVDKLLRGEASIGHTVEHSINGVSGTRDERRRRGLGRVRATSKELEAG
jgi:hypothetical protein